MKFTVLALLAGTTLAFPSLAQTTPQAELLADAATRTSFAAAAGGGWEKGAFYVSDGGNNTLRAGGYTQFRYLMSFRDEDSAGSQDDFTHGFQVRRTRLKFDGTIWDKRLSYVLMGEFGRSDGVFTLIDAFGQYKFDNGVALRWGQFKHPLLRETLVSDTNWLVLEASQAEAVFSQGRSQGVEVSYTGEKWRCMAAIDDGLKTNNTDFTSDKEADFGITGRAEFMFAGKNWDWAKDFTSWKGSEYSGMVGVAAHYQDGGETGGTADTAVAEVTADVSVEGNGWNAFVAGIWRNTDPAGGSSTDDFGLVVQGGFFVSDQLEVYGRYDGVFADDANGDDFNTLTAGVNYYISPQSHAVKLSADVVYYLDNEGASALVSPTTTTGLLADTEDGQFTVRVQMQVVF